ncbi:glycosyltransferase family 49 protein [Lentinula detonsa]|uniref:Glycosyltransferase family 49 protein n=1 Tax=Lentinula detonsa TaxID=2804962 RepID=A0AA38Q301_9AGAR|nr:glycosyltransferase family 49 protein [Lentinula detonsa]
MIVSTSHCARVGQTIALLYAFSAIFYTTHHLLVSPLRACFSIMLNLSSTALPNPSVSTILNAIKKPNYLNTQTPASFWNSDMALLHQSSWFADIDTDLILSKAFSNSMHPSKIVPFFYRASGELDVEDITITTLITSNRFPVFARLVERYQGPISVAIHVNNNSSDYHALLDSIHALYTSTPNMARFVDVHLVMDSFDRQFNTWRNIARLFARTDFVMMLDIDFAICTDFRSAIRANNAIMDKLREGTSAFVIPAFEYVKPEGGSNQLDQLVFPTDKTSLLSAIKARQLDMFHASWEVGHNSTDYPRYYAAPPGEVYKVTRYQAAYEPYIVFKKEGPPWCDERFVGYGGNKAACLFEMYLSGISYYVLSDHFILHQNHLYEEKIRKDERKFNKKIYSDFKYETCLRYFKNYHDFGILNSTRGYNVQKECTKLKGFPQIAQQILR